VAKGLEVRILDLLASDAVDQSKNCDIVLWHWAHDDARDWLVARNVIKALEVLGKQVFPNYKTCSHYDDKIAQHHLFRALSVPAVPTWIWLDKLEAHSWVQEASWPKVFKVRRGAGSANVRLVKSRREADRIIRQAFGRGFSTSVPLVSDFKNRALRVSSFSDLWIKIKRRVFNLSAAQRRGKFTVREGGYVYFQEFLPDNNFDTRVTIIGNRAFGYTRRNRPNDFRASGSGRPDYDRTRVDPQCVRLAFRVAEQFGADSIAFDFLFDRKRAPLVSEVSYCYVSSMVQACGGYWDRDGTWTPSNSWPEELIIDDQLKIYASRTGGESRV
jgi:glutathione synthase/RimK-type ligase-like ATP-grasp enzyme